MFQVPQLSRQFHGSAIPSSDSSQLNKHFAVSPPLVSEIFSAPGGRSNQRQDFKKTER